MRIVIFYGDTGMRFLSDLAGRASRLFRSGPTHDDIKARITALPDTQKQDLHVYKTAAELCRAHGVFPKVVNVDRYVGSALEALGLQGVKTPDEVLQSLDQMTEAFGVENMRFSVIAMTLVDRQQGRDIDFTGSHLEQ